MILESCCRTLSADISER
uniref:Uncharacterized protein n=1 Tax=Anguilla anguilla TaxID=7936 RepID=A0A0E9XCQ9_ANGAN